MHITRVLLAVAVATTGLLGAPVSLAGTPLIIREALEFDLPLVECEGFEVWTSGLEADTFKYWYDEYGVPVRLQWAIHVTEGRYYNRNDPTKFITQGENGVGENNTVRIDLTNGDYHTGGALFRLTIPGIGHVVLLAGTGFWDQSEETFVWHGPGMVLAEGQAGLALCEALD